MRVKVRTAENSSLTRARNIGAMLLMLAVALFLASCGGEEEGGGQQGGGTTQASGGGESAGGAQGVSVATIIDNPSEFYGQQVTVSGLVTEVIGPNAFAIGGNEFVGGESLLIVGAQELPQIVEGTPEGEEIQAQDLVQVTGTLRPAEQQEITDEVGYELGNQVFEVFGGEAAVVASQIVVTPQQGGSTAQAQQQAPVQLTTLIDNPSEFFGQQVTVDGAVARVISPSASVIVPQDRATQMQNEGIFDNPEALAQEGVLVVNTAGTGPNLSPLQTVQATGTVQEFEDVSVFEQEFGVQLGNDEIFSAFSGRPVIAATSVQPQAGETTQQMQETTTSQ